jgi:hypothetical protein
MWVADYCEIPVQTQMRSIEGRSNAGVPFFDELDSQLTNKLREIDVRLFNPAQVDLPPRRSTNACREGSLTATKRANRIGAMGVRKSFSLCPSRELGSNWDEKNEKPMVSANSREKGTATSTWDEFVEYPLGSNKPRNRSSHFFGSFCVR